MIKYQYVMQYYVHVHVCTDLDKAVQTDPPCKPNYPSEPPPPPGMLFGSTHTHIVTERYLNTCICV